MTSQFKLQKKISWIFKLSGILFGNNLNTITVSHFHCRGQMIFLNMKGAMVIENYIQQLMAATESEFIKGMPVNRLQHSKRL